MEPIRIGKSGPYPRSARGTGVIFGFDKPDTEARHQHDVAIFPAETRRSTHHAFSDETTLFIERHGPMIVGEDRELDPMEIQPLGRTDGYIEQSLAEALAADRRQQTYAQPADMRLDLEGMATDIAPADEFAVDDSRQMRIAGSETVAKEIHGFVHRRRIEKAQIPVFARHDADHPIEIDGIVEGHWANDNFSTGHDATCPSIK